MCAPTAAAILLAALTAIPCQGTNTATESKATNNTEISGTRPTFNKVYQMLHTSHTHNQTKLSSSTNLNFPNDLPTLVPQTNCCLYTKNKSDFVIKELNVQNFKNKRAVGIVRTEKDDSSTVRSTVVVPTWSSYLDRKRKIGEVGSSAPLLNYIFDTYSNSHQHRNERPGNGNSIYAAAAPEIMALVGTTAHLDCKVDALHDKLVSWVRRKNEEEPMELLTTGTQQYTSDNRYSARFIPPDIWRLEVKEVKPGDAAHYDCQLSAHPPRTARVTLRVPEVSVRIVDGAGAEVAEQVCEIGSTVALRCEVRGLRMEGGPALLWYRRDDLLNDDTTRGGISVRTEFGANGANSMLRVARVRADDAGRYTCQVAHMSSVPLEPAFVLLHIIKGESLAELHQGGAVSPTAITQIIITQALVIVQRMFY